jgi:hypothetical protein
MPEPEYFENPELDPQFEQILDDAPIPFRAAVRGEGADFVSSLLDFDRRLHAIDSSDKIDEFLSELNSYELGLDLEQRLELLTQIAESSDKIGGEYQDEFLIRIAGEAMQMPDPEAQQEVLFEILQRAEVLADPKEQFTVVRVVAEKASELSNSDALRDVFSQALNTLQTIQDSEFSSYKGDSLIHIAEVASKLPDSHVSRDIIAQTIAIASSDQQVDDVQYTLERLSTAASKLQDPQLAQDLLSQIIASTPQIGDERAMFGGGVEQQSFLYYIARNSTENLDDSAAAKEVLNQALDAAQNIKSPQMRERALLGIVKASTAKPELAQETATAAQQIVEQFSDEDMSPVFTKEELSKRIVAASARAVPEGLPPSIEGIDFESGQKIATDPKIEEVENEEDTHSEEATEVSEPKLQIDDTYPGQPKASDASEGQQQNQRADTYQPNPFRQALGLEDVEVESEPTVANQTWLPLPDDESEPYRTTIDGGQLPDTNPRTKGMGRSLTGEQPGGENSNNTSTVSEAGGSGSEEHRPDTGTANGAANVVAESEDTNPTAVPGQQPGAASFSSDDVVRAPNNGASAVGKQQSVGLPDDLADKPIDVIDLTLGNDGPESGEALDFGESQQRQSPGQSGITSGDEATEATGTNDVDAEESVPSVGRTPLSQISLDELERNLAEVKKARQNIPHDGSFVRAGHDAQLKAVEEFYQEEIAARKEANVPFAGVGSTVITPDSRKIPTADNQTAITPPTHSGSPLSKEAFGTEQPHTASTERNNSTFENSGLGQDNAPLDVVDLTQGNDSLVSGEAISTNNKRQSDRVDSPRMDTGVTEVRSDTGNSDRAIGVDTDASINAGNEKNSVPVESQMTAWSGANRNSSGTPFSEVTEDPEINYQEEVNDDVTLEEPVNSSIALLIEGPGYQYEDPVKPTLKQEYEAFLGWIEDSGEWIVGDSAESEDRPSSPLGSKSFPEKLVTLLHRTLPPPASSFPISLLISPEAYDVLVNGKNPVEALMPPQNARQAFEREYQEMQEASQAIQEAGEWTDQQFIGFGRTVEDSIQWLADLPDGIPVIEQWADIVGWGVKQTSQIPFGLARQSISTGTGMLSTAVNPVDPAVGLYTVAEHAPIPGGINPLKALHGAFDVAINDADPQDTVDRVFDLERSQEEDQKFIQALAQELTKHNPLSQAWAEGRYGEILGRSSFIIGEILVGPEVVAGELGTLGKYADEVAEAGRATRIAENALEASSDVGVVSRRFSDTPDLPGENATPGAQFVDDPGNLPDSPGKNTTLRDSDAAPDEPASETSPIETQRGAIDRADPDEVKDPHISAREEYKAQRRAERNAMRDSEGLEPHEIRAQVHHEKIKRRIPEYEDWLQEHDVASGEYFKDHPELWSKSPPTNRMPVAVENKAALENFYSGEGYEVRQLGRRNEQNVLAVYDSEGNVQSVWVRPGSRSSNDIPSLYQGYRDAYEEIYKEFFGQLPDGYDVDHLFSAARGGQQGYGYVRLELVPTEVNRAWGTYWETKWPKLGRGGHLESVLPGVRGIDWQQWLKFNGISPGEFYTKLFSDPSFSRERLLEIVANSRHPKVVRDAAQSVLEYGR